MARQPTTPAGLISLKTRVNTPIALSELERRWGAVRRAMRAEGIDALVMQHNNPSTGYLRYFTDLVAGGNPTSVVFPLEDEMTLVRHGALGGVRDLSANPDELLAGVKRVLTTPHFNAANYTQEYDAELIVGALAPYARGTIGLLGISEMSHAFGQRVKRDLPRAMFVDATDLVDQIKVIKSEAEQRLIRETAELQDGAMNVLLGAIEPGMREREAVAATVQWSMSQGSDYGTYMIGSAPPGQPAIFGPPHVQNKLIESGDVVSILIENSGPGGYYAELGRTCVLGSAPPELLEEFEFALVAQRQCVALLKPGASCAEVWTAYNDFMREHGRPEEARIHCHGQGYDLVERPLIRFDEPMTIERDMNIACHPSFEHRNTWAWVCDNYLIGESGAGPRLHATAQRIFEL
jgi:Xaa-Pro aminopeptidase